MADRENVIYQLEKTAEFLQKYGFGGFEAIRCAVTLLKEQEDKIRQLRLALQIMNGTGIRVDTKGR